MSEEEKEAKRKSDKTTWILVAAAIAGIGLLAVLVITLILIVAWQLGLFTM